MLQMTLDAWLTLLSSLSKTIDVEVEGEMSTLKDTVNDMVLKLRIFSSEVTRVGFSSLRINHRNNSDPLTYYE